MQNKKVFKKVSSGYTTFFFKCVPPFEAALLTATVLFVFFFYLATQTQCYHNERRAERSVDRPSTLLTRCVIYIHLHSFIFARFFFSSQND